VEVVGLGGKDKDTCEEDLLNDLKARTREFCLFHQLDENQCIHSEQVLFKEASALKENEVGFIPLHVQHTVQLALGLREKDGEQTTENIEINLDDDVNEKIVNFCNLHSIDEKSCQGLVNSTHTTWVNKRRSVINSVTKRGKLALDALTRIEQGRGDWKDVVLATHHLDEILKVDTHSWGTYYLYGALCGVASRTPWIATQLQENNGTLWMQRSSFYYEKALKALSRQIDESAEQEAILNLRALNDKSKILELLGTLEFHLNNVGESRKYLYNAKETSSHVLNSLDSHTDAQLVKTARSTWTSVMIQLLTVEANTDNFAEVDVLVSGMTERQANFSTLSESERVSLLVFRASLFPFVYLDEDDTKVWHVRSMKLLDELNTRFGASRRPENGALHPYLGFYSVYSGAPLGPWSERDLRTSLATLHRRLTPALRYDGGLTFEDNVQREHPIHRIGFISSYFYDHSIGKLLCGTIEQIFHSNSFEVVLIQVGNEHMVRRRPGACRSLWELATSDEENIRAFQLDYELNDKALTRAYKSIHALECDLLVFGEVGLTLSTYFLAFGRMAPVQVAFWGHPLTSGLSKLSSLDYALTSTSFFPPSAIDTGISTATGVPGVCPSQLHLYGSAFIPFTETVRCMDTLGTYFEEPATITEADLEEANSAIDTAFEVAGIPIEQRKSSNLYYLPHKLMKIHPSMDEPLLEILRQDKDGVLVFLCGEEVKPGSFSVFKFAQEKLHKRLQDKAPGAKIIWLPAMKKTVFLAVGTVCAATLEAFGSFGSGVTALEFLSASVPIVAMPMLQTVTPNTHGMYQTIAESRNKSWVKHELSCTGRNQTPYSKCFVDTALRLAKDTAFKTKWVDLLNEVETRNALFANPKVTTEWNKMLRDMHKYARNVRLEKPAITDSSLVIHKSINFEDATSEPSTDKFTQHVIQLKDTLKL